jgi:hypothetical protein
MTVLRDHRRRFLKMAMALGIGRPDTDALLFAEPGGASTLHQPVDAAPARRVASALTFHA